MAAMSRYFKHLSFGTSAALFERAKEGIMSWLDAHESYVMEVAVRDRMDDLHSAADGHISYTEQTSTEQTTTPAGAASDGRRASPANLVLCPRALARLPR
jgi:hypothetical protein